MGINGLMYGQFTQAQLQPLCKSSQLLVVRAPVRSSAEAKAVLDGIAPCANLSALLLVEQPDLRVVASLLAVNNYTNLAGIELGNELDLYGLTAQQFGDFVLTAYRLLRDGGFQGAFISGGIFSTQDDSLDYLKAASTNWPSDIAIGIHPYEELDDTILAKLQAFHLEIAATEYGLSSRNAVEDEAQRAYLVRQTAMLTRLGAQWAIPYQLVSGACGDLSSLANFGLFDCHGNPIPSFMELFR